MAYVTEVADLTVPRAIGEITDLFGNVIGHQHESTVYPAAGTVLEDDQVAPFIRELVENGELEGRLKKVGDDALDQEVQEPFPDYGELEVEEVQALFRILPSDAVRSIQTYEIEHGENRAGIVDWHIGRGEAYTDRLTGRAGSPHQEGAEDKVTSQFVTREVGESDVRFGESYIDDGTPLREPGELDGDERSELEKASSDDASTDDTPRAKRGRRAKTAKAKPAARTATGDEGPKNEGVSDEDKKNDQE